MTCWACLGQTTNSKVAFVIRGAACYGPRARRAKRSGRSSAKAPGSSYPGHRQKPSSWMPCVKPRPRTWSKKDSVLLRIANGSACRAAPSDRPKRNSINCVRGGRHYSLQAQGDFRGTAHEDICQGQGGDASRPRQGRGGGQGGGQDHRPANVSAEAKVFW